jgi:hypothetical protein
LRPFSQRHAFARRDLLIQGDSVRQIWGVDESETEEDRKPIRRDAPRSRPATGKTDDLLRLRLGEELDYARRMLDVTGNQLSADPIAVARHTRILQSLDIVGQILGHISGVIRSSDPETTVNQIGMSDLRARLTRSGAL